MKHVILANPMSGKKRGIKYANRIQKILKKNNINATIIFSKYPKYFTEVAKEIANTEKTRFYSIGGDGTLNEIVSGIIGTSSEIVIIPCGTGNDFLRSISDYLSMRKIVNISLEKKATPTDVITFGKDKYCINVLNMGFDAMIAKNIDKFRKVPFISGSAKYTLSILYTLSSSRNFKFKISANKRVYKGSFTLVAIANGKYYGGGIMPCPDANVDDGILDSCIIDATTVMSKLKLLPKYKKGKHLTLKPVNLLKSNEIKVVSNHKFPVSADGEMYYTNRLHIKVLPRAVNIVHIK